MNSEIESYDDDDDDVADDDYDDDDLYGEDDNGEARSLVWKSLFKAATKDD